MALCDNSSADIHGLIPLGNGFVEDSSRIMPNLLIGFASSLTEPKAHKAGHKV